MESVGGQLSPSTAWRTRDIVIAAVIGVVFGVIFLAWQTVWGFFEFLPVPFQDWSYGMWLAPAVLAPLLIRKPGAALFAEMVAAGVSALLGSAWGPDTLLSGFVQGAAAELIFAFTVYRNWSLVVVGIAAVASAAAAWAHDWVLYYPTVAVEVQTLRLVVMAASAILFAGVGSIALERALRRAGVVEGLGG
jgi:energy-coupling factor transport system permease protein